MITPSTQDPTQCELVLDQTSNKKGSAAIAFHFGGGLKALKPLFFYKKSGK